MDFSKILTSLINGVGNVVWAAVLLVLAFVVSSIVKGLIVGLLNKTKLKNYEESNGMITYVGKLTYLFVFLLFIP